MIGDKCVDQGGTEVAGRLSKHYVTRHVSMYRDGIHPRSKVGFYPNVLDSTLDMLWSKNGPRIILCLER